MARFKTIKFFIPNDVISCLKPLLYVSRLCFVLPFSITPDGKIIIRPSLDWIFFTVSIISFVTYNVGQFGVEKYPGINKSHNPFWLLSLVRLLSLDAYFLLFLLKIRKINKKIVKIAQKFQTLEKYYPLSKEDVKDVFRISVIETVLYYVIGSGILTATLMSREFSWTTLLFLWSYGHCVLFCNLYELTFVNGICLTSKYVKVAQKTLKKLAKSDEWRPMNKMYMKNLSLLKIENKDYTSAISNVLSIKETKSQTIRKLRLGYRLILEIKEDINKAFSFVIFLSIANIFIQATFFAFLNVVVLQLEATKYEKLNFMVVVGYTVTISLKLALITIVCQNLTTKLGKTGEIVHGLFSKPQDFEMKEELLLFTSELMHRDTKITAYKFFAIDFQLVHSIIAAVFMYIIILFQFKFTDDKGETNPIDSLMYYMNM